MPRIRTATKLRQVSCSPHLCPVVLDPTSPWTLLPVCPPLKVTPPSPPSLTGSPKLHLLFLCPNSPQLLRQPSSWYNIFRIHRIPLDILSDCGPHFASQVWKAFCTSLGANVSLSSGHHLQSNGQTERCNQELEVALRCVINHNPSSWS